ncbi:MAG: ankyrin repeat domain-containing protein [Leptolyngbya sp. SIO3F4]|nr:ankyrin repeat domain-containing protein [Leptolyngbya sp. SIO3F4]
MLFLLTVFVMLSLSMGLEGCHLIEQQTQVDTSAVAATAPPLIAATLVGNVDEVRSLLEQGTDPNLVYHTNTALTYAARDGFTEIARLLIEHGAEVNWIDGEGVTPLILASFKDHIDLVQLLLAHGADIAVRDQWNRTALDYALRRGETDPIAQLLQSSN